MKPKLTISPKKYNGWKLEYNEHCKGRDTEFQAEKDGISLFAGDLDDLMQRIDDTERQLVRLVRPLAVMIRPSLMDKFERTEGWRKAQITMIDGDTFYYRDEYGKTSHYSLNRLDSDMSDPEHPRYPIVAMTADNRSIERKSERLRKRAHEMLNEATDILKTMTPCTAGDIRLAGKGGAE